MGYLPVCLAINNGLPSMPGDKSPGGMAPAIASTGYIRRDIAARKFISVRFSLLTGVSFSSTPADNSPGYGMTPAKAD